MPRRYPPLPERFWAKVERLSDDECWEWKASRFRLGYGSILVDGRNRSAHRISWELTHGTIPEGMHVMHRCDNRACVNPAHLELGSHQDNMRDRGAKGRHSRASRNVGEAHPLSRLTASDVGAIRERYAQGGIRQIDLAAEYGVTRTRISTIVNRRGWRSL
jgi:hypothetical protein